MLSSHGFPVEEITGGCFCCRFNSLVEASNELTERAAPDVFIAEPVGSCTDLKATVDYPLRRLYGANYQVAPLSVLVDPARAARILGLREGNSFSPKVLYIYRKQLEEAELIVVNKTDTLDAAQLEQLTSALASNFPTARIMPLCARTGEGLEAWADEIALSATPRLSGAMDVDYVTYAEGEALLGWLNCALSVSSASEFDGNALLVELGRAIQDRLRDGGYEVAHLKMTLAPGENGNDIAVGNLVRNDGTLELSHRLAAPLTSGNLLLNLRAECTPETLRALTEEVIDRLSDGALQKTVEHLECFSPGKPEPTHRMAAV